MVYFGYAKAFNPFAYVNALNHWTFVHICTEGHDSLVRKFQHKLGMYIYPSSGKCICWL